MMARGRAAPLAMVPDATPAASEPATHRGQSEAAARAAYDARLAQSPDWPVAPGDWRGRLMRRLASPGPRYAFAGFLLFFGLWYLLTAVVVPPRFNFIPNPAYLFGQWTSKVPQYGISLFTPEYYEHIRVSVIRVYTAFVISVALGAPLGILLGWSRLGRNLLFPIVEMLRPIPPLAWVPLAVLSLSGTESAVIFVTMLASFFATVLNTYLGVRSIPETYFRAAACLGYRRLDILRRVVIPGALPFIFTGLQIAMGVAWFSLVGGELIAGRSGLGYLILDGYTQLALPNIFIGMITLGVLGWASSAVIRKIGDVLMAWHVKGRGEGA
ncbi:MAG: ABC transporter permease [Burkholderiales bacterium]|nr:ABC transporter permease [Burkholderiales bacterium]